jgi:outer membrane protein
MYDKNNNGFVTQAVLTISVSCAMAFFGTVRADDMLSVYGLALDSDPVIKAAAAERDAALEVIPQSMALLLPDINITADVSRDRFDPRDSDEDTSYATNETYSLQLRQAVYQRERFVRLKQADHRAAQADATYVAAQQDLILRVTTNYFQVLGALDNQEFVVADKEAIAVTLEQAQQRYEVGLAAVTDVYEAQARYDLAVSEELNAEKLLNDAREALRRLTGVAPGYVNILKPAIPLVSPDPASPEEWLAMALEQNPTLLAATAATSAAKDQIQVQRSGHYPSLDLVAEYQYRDNDFGGLGIPIERNDGAIGLQLNIPIYQGGLISSRTRQASYEYSKVREDQMGAHREVENQIRDSYSGVVVEMSKVGALYQAILSSEKALEASQAGFDVGTRTIVDVLDSQRELLRARRDHARSRYAYLLNGLRLKQAAGIVAEPDLASINDMLEEGLTVVSVQ